MPKEIIDPANKFLIGLHQEQIVFVTPVPQRISQADALLLAAWLVVMVGDDDLWARTLDAVQQTADLGRIMDLPKVSLDVDDGLPKLGQRAEGLVSTVQIPMVKEQANGPTDVGVSGGVLRWGGNDQPKGARAPVVTLTESTTGTEAVRGGERLPLGRGDPLRDLRLQGAQESEDRATQSLRDTSTEGRASLSRDPTLQPDQESRGPGSVALHDPLPTTESGLTMVATDEGAEAFVVGTSFNYIAGPAGCGKTFLVRGVAERNKGIVLCATTGIAAINLGGSTINALLGFFDTRSLQESYTNGFLTARLGRLWKAGVKRLVVDEVSMLSGDQLTYLVKGIEEVNGRGYVLGKWDAEDESEPPAMGLTLVGDFAQLPPVKEPFAFDSSEWGRFAEPGHTKILTEIRRQSDAGFINMLRAARVGNGQEVLNFFRGRIHQETDDEFQGPTLFAKNDAVDRYNWIRLGRVPGRDCYFESRREGDQRSEWGNPKKPPTTWGIPLRLHCKVGALVMILANQRAEGPPPQPFIYVNGDLGEVVDATEQSALVKLQRTGDTVPVSYVRREVLIPCDSARRKELRDKGQAGRITENGKFEITGWIEYMPLRVAYGSTVHKSQGLSLDRVQVNIRDAFFKSPGMMYVALSRCRTAEGLRLVGSEAALVERCAADPRLKAWL